MRKTYILFSIHENDRCEMHSRRRVVQNMFKQRRVIVQF